MLVQDICAEVYFITVELSEKNFQHKSVPFFVAWVVPSSKHQLVWMDLLPRKVHVVYISSFTLKANSAL